MIQEGICSDISAYTSLLALTFIFVRISDNSFEKINVYSIYTKSVQSFSPPSKLRLYTYIFLK